MSVSHTGDDAEATPPVAVSPGPGEGAAPPPGGGPGWPIAWILTGLLVVAIAGAVVAIAVDGESGSPPDVAVDPDSADEPVGVSEEALRAFAADHEDPVYWAGPRHETTYELTLSEGGDVFVRYLPPGVAVGTERADFLTVATYTRPAAYQALLEVASGSAFTSEDTASGALVVSAEDNPTSAHFSFPDTDLQVEVFDPEPGRARSLVLDGSITLVRAADDDSS